MTITDKTRKLLWGLSAGRCAMCNRELIEARESGDAHTVVGEECHILSKTGPRSVPSLAVQELDSYDNLVLLCNVHHKMVDDQEHAFPEDRLRALKLEHERRVARRQSDQGFTRAALAPMRPPLLVGRNRELDALKSRLCNPPAEGGAPIQLLTSMSGWPGVGKTSISAALAHDRAIVDHFPDGVLWASLGQSPNVLWELVAWGRALRIPRVVEVRAIAELSSLLAAVLCDRRALLIVDDVWAVEHAAPFRVGGRFCATLITTRAPAIATALAATPDQVYRLPVLTDESSCELLATIAPEVMREHPAESAELLRALEGLPLAIQVAGRLLESEQRHGLGAGQLLHELRTGAALLEAPAPADRVDVARATTPTIAALLQKSTDALSEEVRERFAYLGAFAPKPARFTFDVLRDVWRTDHPLPTMRVLLDRGLVEAVPDAQYQIHALLALHARSLARP